MTARAALWTAIAAAVVLATRTVVYALAPQSVLLAALAHGEGGPRVAGALIAAVAIGASVAAIVLWVSLVAVRERYALEGRALVTVPRLRPGLLALRTVALFLASSLTFALTESYIHWRDGLGWHGLNCLIGPVHRDAIPLLIALSLVAVAVHGALELLLAWARRLFAALAARAVTAALSALSGLPPQWPRCGTVTAWNDARGPPRSPLLACL